MFIGNITLQKYTIVWTLGLYRFQWSWEYILYVEHHSIPGKLSDFWGATNRHCYFPKILANTACILMLTQNDTNMPKVYPTFFAKCGAEFPWFSCLCPCLRHWGQGRCETSAGEMLLQQKPRLQSNQLSTWRCSGRQGRNFRCIYNILDESFMHLQELAEVLGQQSQQPRQGRKCHPPHLVIHGDMHLNMVT